MAKTLNQKITRLERDIKLLKSKMLDLSRNTEESVTRPYSKVGGIRDRSQIRPIDIDAGLGQVYGGNFIWNDAELIMPPYGTSIPTPTKGYNKHGHSRYSGGAMDINTLELVEYETNEEGEIVDKNGSPLNRHSQGFWKNPAKIAKDGTVEKIGNLEIEFDPTLRKWVAGANYIDVERTYLVKYVWKDEEGNTVPAGTEGAIREIAKDANGNEMKSPLLVSTFPPTGEGEEEQSTREMEDLEKSNIVWDSVNKSWRFYAVFKPWTETEPAE